MNDPVINALVSAEFEKRFTELKELMAYADQRSTREDHDGLLEIVSECALERMNVTPSTRTYDTLIAAFESLIDDCMSKNDLIVVVWLREMQRRIKHFVEDFPVIPGLEVIADDQVYGEPGSIGNPLRKFDYPYGQWWNPPRKKDH